eukprot:g1674.t1
MILTARTAFWRNEELVYETRDSIILTTYLKSWFIIDFASTVPIDKIAVALASASSTEGSSSGYALRSIKMVRIVRLIRLLKLARLLKLSKFAGQIDEYIEISPGALRLFSLFFQITFIAHLLGCFWYYVSSFDEQYSWWRKPMLELTGTYVSLGDKYVASLYWSFSTISTVGYGDIAAVTNIEKWYSVFAMLLGATVFGYIVGSITSLVDTFDEESRNKRRIDEVKAYMKERRVPKMLQKRVKMYYQYFLKNTVQSEERIFERVSETLKRDIMKFVLGGMIKKIPFFSAIDNEIFSLYVLKNMERVFCVPGDFLFRVGDAGMAMYYLAQGTVEVCGKNGEHFTNLNEGSLFGEIALLCDMPRTATIKALSFCMLYKLEREGLDQIKSIFPKMEREMELHIYQRITLEQRMKEYQQDIQQDRTEVDKIIEKVDLESSSRKQPQSPLSSSDGDVFEEEKGTPDRISSTMKSKLVDEEEDYVHVYICYPSDIVDSLPLEVELLEKLIAKASRDMESENERSSISSTLITAKERKDSLAPKDVFTAATSLSGRLAADKYRKDVLKHLSSQIIPEKWQRAIGVVILDEHCVASYHMQCFFHIAMTNGLPLYFVRVNTDAEVLLPPFLDESSELKVKFDNTNKERSLDEESSSTILSTLVYKAAKLAPNKRVSLSRTGFIAKVKAHRKTVNKRAKKI